MKLKFVLASILLFGAVSMANAQGYVPGFGGKFNCVKTDFNLGWFISDFEDQYGDKHSGLFGTGFSVSYNHVFKQGFGFGVDCIIENGDDEDDILRTNKTNKIEENEMQQAKKIYFHERINILISSE